MIFFCIVKVVSKRKWKYTIYWRRLNILMIYDKIIYWFKNKNGWTSANVWMVFQMQFSYISDHLFFFSFFLSFLLKFGDHLFFSHSYIHNLSMFMQLWVEEYNDLVDMYSFGMCMFFCVKQHVHFLFLFWPNGETPRLSLVVLIPHLYSSHGI